MPTPDDPKTDLRCPVCGREGLADIAFDAQPAEDAKGGPPRPAQTADSRQVITYACGHQVPGPSLAMPIRPSSRWNDAPPRTPPNPRPES